jgi:hypothetical protein
MDDFLAELTGPVSDEAEGAPRSGPVIVRCLCVPGKLGPHELQAECDMQRELWQRGLSRCAFEDQNPETGEVTTVGGLTDAEQIEANAIMEKWQPKIQAARAQDGRRN